MWEWGRDELCGVLGLGRESIDNEKGVKESEKNERSVRKRREGSADR
jgi:hypothetical protein